MQRLMGTSLVLEHQGEGRVNHNTIGSERHPMPVKYMGVAPIHVGQKISLLRVVLVDYLLFAQSLRNHELCFEGGVFPGGAN